MNAEVDSNDLSVKDLGSMINEEPVAQEPKLNVNRPNDLKSIKR